MNIFTILVDSIDSLFNNPIDIRSCEAIGPFPNMETITVGFTNVSEDVWIDATLNVTLGGSSTTKMHVAELKLAGNSTGLTRSSTLESLTLKYILLQDTFMSRLDLYFGNLQSLEVDSADYYYLEEIRLPPQAVNWTGGFVLSILSNPKLNLTSQYTTDDAGNQVQT